MNLRLPDGDAAVDAPRKGEGGVVREGGRGARPETDDPSGDGFRIGAYDGTVDVRVGQELDVAHRGARSVQGI
jgi:hypothetical protein